MKRNMLILLVLSVPMVAFSNEMSSEREFFKTYFSLKKHDKAKACQHVHSVNSEKLSNLGLYYFIKGICLADEAKYSNSLVYLDDATKAIGDSIEQQGLLNSIATLKQQILDVCNADQLCKVSYKTIPNKSNKYLFRPPINDKKLVGQHMEWEGVFARKIENTYIVAYWNGSDRYWWGFTNPESLDLTQVHDTLRVIGQYKGRKSFSAFDGTLIEIPILEAKYIDNKRPTLYRNSSVFRNGVQ